MVSASEVSEYGNRGGYGIQSRRRGSFRCIRICWIRARDRPGERPGRMRRPGICCDRPESEDHLRRLVCRRRCVHQTPATGGDGSGRRGHWRRQNWSAMPLLCRKRPAYILRRPRPSQKRTRQLRKTAGRRMGCSLRICCPSWRRYFKKWLPR